MVQIFSPVFVHQTIFQSKKVKHFFDWIELVIRSAFLESAKKVQEMGIFWGRRKWIKEMGESVKYIPFIFSLSLSLSLFRTHTQTHTHSLSHNLSPPLSLYYLSLKRNSIFEKYII